VNRLAERPERSDVAPETLRFGECELDFARGELRRAGALVELPPTPLRVLLYLAEHRDRTVPRRELLDAIWPDAVVGDESLTRAVAEIRRATGEADGGDPVVRTFKRAGLRFVARLEADERSAVESRPSRPWLARLGGLALAAGIAVAGALALRGDAPTPFGVAVLPVANFTGDAAAQPLADGLTEQVTHALAENGYPVVARTTAAQFRERAADVRELGERLGVSHVLEGSVRSAGDRLRVTMQLVASDTGKHVWSEVFERPRGSDGFALQDDVTDRVAVRVYHYVWEDAVAIREDPALAELSRLLVETRRLFLEDRPYEFLQTADRLLAATPEREPYLSWRANTHALIADTWSMLYAFGPHPHSEAGPKLLRHASAAVALAPDEAHPHASLSRALVHHWRWDEAEREVRRACELAPSDGAHCGSARWNLCAAFGCVAEQIEGATAWAHQEPAEYGAWALLAVALLNDGRLDEADRVGARARALGIPWGGLLDPSLQWRLGRSEAAIEGAARQLVALGAREAERELRRQARLVPERAWRWLADQRAARAKGVAPPNLSAFLAAQGYAELGDHAAALAALEASVARHEPGMEQYGLDPIFDPIRETPRFRALIEKMGLTARQAEYATRERRVVPIALP
jgi:adenylate cyclase